MRKLKLKALDELLRNEEHALSVLAGVPTAIIVVGFIVAVLSITFLK